MPETLENTGVLVKMWIWWKMWIRLFLEEKKSKLYCVLNKKYERNLSTEKIKISTEKIPV